MRTPALAYLRFSPLPDSVVHAVRVDLQAPGVQVQLSPPSERGQAVADMASSAGALASINASFFNAEQQPRGLTVSEGVAWAPVMAVQASPLLACDAQPRCVIELQPPFALKPEWRNVVAGTPWLLDQGRERTPADDAGCPKLCAMTHPRTAVGLDASGRYLFLLVSEGRRPPVLGLTLAQLSAVMKQLGAWQAVNLDGGGSSTLIVQGQSLLARPFNEPMPRKVANALQIRVNE
ncbi:MAG: phosphodiester glycosidase family protein [Burkholderiaceae bacterium]